MSFLSNFKSEPKKRTWTTPHGNTYSLFQDALSKPHLLVCGSTGSGKSVLINGLISTMLYRFPEDVPDGAQLILIDPKRVELMDYAALPHTITHAAGHNPEAWAAALKTAENIMDARYNRMTGKQYDSGDLYVIIDEWAAIKTSGGKECYNSVLRLTSEGRAAKVHIILATQYPTAKILPTEIRGNFDWRFALRTNNATESRIAMNDKGCEDLPDYGQGYYSLPGKDNNVLYKIPYVEQPEIDRLITWWIEQKSA